MPTHSSTAVARAIAPVDALAAALTKRTAALVQSGQLTKEQGDDLRAQIEAAGVGSSYTRRVGQRSPSDRWRRAPSARRP
jgi:hypothetical protein